MTPDELVESWWRTAQGQLQRADFAGVLNRKRQLKISFVVQLIAPRDGVIAPWIPRVAALLERGGFDVNVQHEVTADTLIDLGREAPDILLVWSTTSDMQTLCTAFAAESSNRSRLLVCVPEGDDGLLYCRLLRERHHAETISIPLEKLQHGEECRFGIDVLRKCSDHLSAKVATTSREARLKNTYILLVHGIRTRALWQGAVRASFEKDGVVAWPTNYNKFDVIRFLLPFDRLKKSAIDRVRNELISLRKKSPTAEVGVVAHSFGSHIIGSLLRSGEKFKAIAFTGAVLPANFDFSTAGGVPIVNEVARWDAWPVLAEKIGWGYGATGTFGFNCGSVTDRIHARFGHSTSLTSEFCTRFWVPFFCSGSIVSTGDDDARPSGIVRLLDGVPLPLLRALFWLPIVGVIGAAGFFLLVILLRIASGPLSRLL